MGFVRQSAFVAPVLIVIEHAARQHNSLSFPCSLPCLPFTTASRLAFIFVTLTCSSSQCAGTKINSLKEETNMANNTKSQPVKTLRMGRIQAAVWENHSDKGPFYNVTLRRDYKEGDTWKSSNSFGRDDLLVLCQVLGAAYTF